jgi:hypothetical protein
MIFAPKRKEVIGQKKRHNKELHNLHPSPDVLDFPTTIIYVFISLRA